MRIESWNINSLRAHLQALEAHLRTYRPDVMCLQETMLTDAKFPHERIEAAGYLARCVGQKGKNGVAVLTRQVTCQSVDMTRWLPTAVPRRGVFEEARFLACRIGSTRVACVYVPFGRTPSDPQWQDKQVFLAALAQWVRASLQAGDLLLVAGDFNVAPTAHDVSDQALFDGHAWCHADMRAALQPLWRAGLIDVGRIHLPHGRQATLWDERRFGKGTPHGVRVDLLLASPDVAARCVAAGIHVTQRFVANSSDHVPVWCDVAEH